MINFGIVIIIIAVVIVFSKSRCYSNIKKWCHSNVAEYMFNEDKLFKRDIYGDWYRIGYDNCS